METENAAKKWTAFPGGLTSKNTCLVLGILQLHRQGVAGRDEANIILLVSWYPMPYVTGTERLRE